ncbi:hypothetical protein BDZ89DRAFT_1066489 [Hymenopellis radicata]|nr:hypothetical protein BDZ89DRAFT_1066489 [Hymenopellis radicata]
MPHTFSWRCPRLFKGIFRKPSEHRERPDLPRPDLMNESLPIPKVMLGASSVPVEILQHIFTLDAESYQGFHLCPGAKHPALRLAHVSRAWRTAALGTSVLWSRLKVNISSAHVVTGRKYCANGNAASSWRWCSALDDFFVLAQDFPLHISLTCSGMPRWIIDEEIQDILAALLHTAPRWKSLSLVFRVDEEGGQWFFLDPLHDRLDSLEKLHITVFKSYYDTRLSLSRCAAFRDAPKLTNVCISPDIVILVELPWSRLLHVDFTFNESYQADEADQFALIMHDFLVGLENADQLKTLGCRECHGAPIMDQPVVVELPCLEDMTLFASSHLVHRVVLPSLSKLRIYESHFHSEDNPAPAPSTHLIQSLVVRSKCGIISLTITDAVAFRTVDGLRDIAHHLPQLVSLGLEQSQAAYRASRCDISLGVFSLLTSGHSLFPLLQNVFLSTRAQSLDPDDVFRILPSLSGMLASRAQTDSAAARVFAHARVYRPTITQRNFTEGSVQGPYHQYSEVVYDTRWQTLTGEYRGQMNVLIEVIGTTTAVYDYQVWLGRTPEPEEVWL